MTFHAILPLIPGLNAPAPTQSQATMLMMPRQTPPTAPVGGHAVQQAAPGSDSARVQAAPVSPMTPLMAQPGAALAQGLPSAPGRGVGIKAFWSMADTVQAFGDRSAMNGPPPTQADSLLEAVKALREADAWSGPKPRVTA